MATIKEIAELSGFSRGTVDRVLNHRGTVKPETEQKIQEIVKLLEYQPNKAGMALAAQKKKYKIGVLLFGAQNPFFDEVMSGLHRKLEELSIYGCTLIEKRIAFAVEEQLSAIDAFVLEGINGLILSPYDSPLIQEKMNELADLDIPCITVNTDMPESGRIAYVGSNSYQCGQTAAGVLSFMLPPKGKIGIITGSHNVRSHEERISGFCDTIQRKSPDTQILEICENNDDDYASYSLVTRMLTLHPNIDALYFTAAGVHGGCKAVQASCNPVDYPRIICMDTIASTKDMIELGVITAAICQQPLIQGSLSLSLLVDYLLTRQMPKACVNYVDLSIVIKENLVTVPGEQ